MAGVRYTVVFTASAEKELMNSYIESAPGERAELSYAANQLEKALRIDPDMKGDPHPTMPGFYVWRLAPLKAHYRVSEPDRLVTVVRIGRITELTEGS